MTELSKFDRWFNRWAWPLFLLFIVIVLLFYMGTTVYWMFNPKPAEQVVFKIVGINNETLNSSTLTNLHFECIKYCNDKSSSDYRRSCWEQCAMLGKEGCSNGAQKKD